MSPAATRRRCIWWCRRRIHRSPRRKIVRHRPPGNTVTDHIPKTVEQFPQIMMPLFRVFFHQKKIRDNQQPFFIADIRRIRF